MSAPDNDGLTVLAERINDHGTCAFVTDAHSIFTIIAFMIPNTYHAELTARVRDETIRIIDALTQLLDDDPVIGTYIDRLWSNAAMRANRPVLAHQRTPLHERN
jgi:hypothetical protein